MPKFKDSKDREWMVEITIGTTMRLKDAGVNFHELAENKYAKFIALQYDDEALAHILYAIIRPQAEPLGVTEDDFVQNDIYGEALFAGWEAFRSAFLNFTRDPKIRSSLNDLLDRSQRLQDRAAKLMAQKSEQMEKIGHAKIDQMAAQMDDARMGALLDEQLSPIVSAADIERAVFRLAGFVSVDPRPFTFRELFLMAEGKASHEWNFWSSSLALTANCNRDPKKTRPFQPQDFNPFTAAEAAKSRKGGVGDFLIAMKAMCRKNRFTRR